MLLWTVLYTDPISYTLNTSQYWFKYPTPQKQWALQTGILHTAESNKEFVRCATPCCYNAVTTVNDNPTQRFSTSSGEIFGWYSTGTQPRHRVADRRAIARSPWQKSTDITLFAGNSCQSYGGYGGSYGNCC